MWWNLVPKEGVPVPSLHESVPIKISSLDDLEVLEQICSFYSADGDTDATVTCSGVVWSCLFVSQGTDVDLLSEFVIFMIAPSPKFVFHEVKCQNDVSLKSIHNLFFECC